MHSKTLENSLDQLQRDEQTRGLSTGQGNSQANRPAPLKMTVGRLKGNYPWSFPARFHDISSSMVEVALETGCL